MASLIDSSYFVSDLHIPNVTGTHPVAASNATALNSLILRYEKDYLIKLLGDTLYGEFIAALAANTAWALNLKAQIVDATNKVSPIAYYVWYWWMRINASTVTSQGEAEATNENAVKVSPALRMTTAYNTMVDLTEDVIEWMYANRTTLPSSPDTDDNLITPINAFNI